MLRIQPPSRAELAAATRDAELRIAEPIRKHPWVKKMAVDPNNLAPPGSGEEHPPVSTSNFIAGNMEVKLGRSRELNTWMYYKIFPTVYLRFQQQWDDALAMVALNATQANRNLSQYLDSVKISRQLKNFSRDVRNDLDPADPTTLQPLVNVLVSIEEDFFKQFQEQQATDFNTQFKRLPKAIKAAVDRMQALMQELHASETDPSKTKVQKEQKRKEIIASLNNEDADWAQEFRRLDGVLPEVLRPQLRDAGEEIDKLREFLIDHAESYRKSKKKVLILGVNLNALTSEFLRDNQQLTQALPQHQRLPQVFNDSVTKMQDLMKELHKVHADPKKSRLAKWRKRREIRLALRKMPEDWQQAFQEMRRDYTDPVIQTRLDDAESKLLNLRYKYLKFVRRYGAAEADTKRIKNVVDESFTNFRELLTFDDVTGEAVDFKSPHQEDSAYELACRAMEDILNQEKFLFDQLFASEGHRRRIQQAILDLELRRGMSQAEKDAAQAKLKAFLLQEMQRLYEQRRSQVERQWEIREQQLTACEDRINEAVEKAYRLQEYRELDPRAKKSENFVNLDMGDQAIDMIGPDKTLKVDKGVVLRREKGKSGKDVDVLSFKFNFWDRWISREQRLSKMFHGARLMRARGHHELLVSTGKPIGRTSSFGLRFMLGGALAMAPEIKHQTLDASRPMKYMAEFVGMCEVLGIKPIAMVPMRRNGKTISTMQSLTVPRGFESYAEEGRRYAEAMLKGRANQAAISAHGFPITREDQIGREDQHLNFVEPRKIEPQNR